MILFNETMHAKDPNAKENVPQSVEADAPASEEITQKMEKVAISAETVKGISQHLGFA